MAITPKQNTFIELICRSVLLLVISVSIVNLQAALTSNFGNIENFVAGRMGPIFSSRVLTRWILQILSEAPFNCSLASANFGLQTIILFLSLSLIYKIGATLFSNIHGLVSAIICAVMLPWGFLSSGFSISYPYDLPVILVTTLGIYAIIKRLDLLFYCVLMIGALNKETSVWLIPIFILYNKQGSYFNIQIAKKLLISSTVFIGSYISIRYALYGSLIFNDCTRFFSTHRNQDPRILLNLIQFMHPFGGKYPQWIYFPLIVNLLPLLNFKRLPRIFKCSYLAIPFYLAPIFFVGNLNEFRLFNEILPITALALPFCLSRNESIK